MANTRKIKQKRYNKKKNTQKKRNYLKFDASKIHPASLFLLPIKN
jgi:hypothetical protein